MNELVSAVITTYGRKFEEIERSILSVLSQTYKNIEIVLVDDNFPETNFRTSIENGIIKYPTVKYVQHEKNKGAQKARNTGIENSRGDYIAFLDDDDEWLPRKIEKQMELINPSIGLVYCRGYYIDEEEGIERPYANDRNFRNEVFYEDLLYGDYIGTTTQALIPKQVLISLGGFRIDQPARQDYEMWIRISKEFRCVGVDEPLFKHYIHKGEQISKSSTKAILGMENIYSSHKEDYKKNPLAEVHVLFHLANQYKSIRDLKMSIYYYCKAILRMPKMFFLNLPQLLKLIKLRRRNK